MEMQMTMTTEQGAELATTQLDQDVARGKFIFLTSFGAKRFQNPVQMRAVELLIVTHGLEKFQAGVEWAAKMGMSRGRAVLSLEKALPTWGMSREERAKQQRDYRKTEAGRHAYSEWEEAGR
jgi:hypothetical protein